MKHLYYGAAYYDEYMPCERLAKDVEMLKKAGMNVVRIAESTWSTWEPQNGVFDFTHLDRVLDAMEEAGIDVIVGTPTYAFPTWLAKEHPDILGVTKRGKELYGRRQNMDITNASYRFYGERIIRKLMERTASRKCVIGYQLDNETKHYDAANESVQQLFVKHLKQEFDTCEAMNQAFGLDYWSNRINAWEDFPDVRGTINGSLATEFEKFQRGLVTEFLAWQAKIVREYLRDDQFITHNFDFEWHGYSYGIQPDVNHFDAAGCLDIAGCDIYHPTQDDLTGKEIAMGGDLMRALKGGNYFILETEAQGFPMWTPYDGQLRLQAFSHLGSGANMVEYWHWHSIHNSMETYWRGVLSHDFAENATYREAMTIGAEMKALSSNLVNLKKQNRVAIVVSNESLTALKYFPIDVRNPDALSYNDVMRWCYDALYELNVEVDFLFPQQMDKLNRYDVVVVPALYSAPESMLQALADYAKRGGELVVTFKSGYTDEYVKVYHDTQPHILCEALGIEYNQFTYPNKVYLNGETLPHSAVEGWMELVTPKGADVLASYDHYNWKRYAAITEHAYGDGMATYLACKCSKEALREVFVRILKRAGLYGPQQEIALPVKVKQGINEAGHRVAFYYNYSEQPQTVPALFGGTELTQKQSVAEQERLTLEPWNFLIVEEA